MQTLRNNNQNLKTRYYPKMVAYSKSIINLWSSAAPVFFYPEQTYGYI